VKFSLLGPVTVTSEAGQVITPGPLKLRALLAILMLNAGQTVVTDQLVDQLWDGKPPGHGKAVLQNYISRLRGHLAGPDGESGARPLLVTRPGGYSLQALGREVDLKRFAALRAQALAEESAGHLERASALLSSALAEWNGPALADVRDIACLEAVASRLDEARMLAQETRIGVELRLDRHVSTLAELCELTAHHPLRESLHERLMLAQYRSGRTAESLDTYRRIRSALVRELGLEPNQRLQLLHKKILSRDPALQPVPEPDLWSTT
jgi:DNA-binding SARP family transcriptional activator